ncbi:hypothetical protein BH10PSE14_BH10PSE14_04610 [soil metagenome]
MSNRTDLLTAREAIDLVETGLGTVEQRVESNAATLRIGRARAMLRAAAGELAIALNLPVDIVTESGA